MASDRWPDAPAAGEPTGWTLGENTRAVNLPPPPIRRHQSPGGGNRDDPAAEAFATAVAAMEGGYLAVPLRPETRIVYAETLATPTAAVADLPALAGLAHAIGALLVVDSTLAPPVVCRPLEHGADLVLHAAADYIGGHCDASGGVVAGRPDLIGMIHAVRADTGGWLAPDQAFTLRHGLETLPVRVRRQCVTAMLFAAALARHPAVGAVDYPGLPEHPGHELARRLFDAGPEGTRCGATVTVTPHGGREVGYAFAGRLHIARTGESPGGAHTTASHLATSGYRGLDAAALAAAGIDPGAVRFSIGLEDGEDLIADAHLALDSLGTG